MIGNAASGEDISRDIAKVAKDVHISGRTWGSSVDFGEPVGQHSNIFRHSTVTTFHSFSLSIHSWTIFWAILCSFQ